RHEEREVEGDHPLDEAALVRLLLLRRELPLGGGGGSGGGGGGRGSSRGADRSGGGFGCGSMRENRRGERHQHQQHAAEREPVGGQQETAEREPPDAAKGMGKIGRDARGGAGGG